MGNIIRLDQRLANMIAAGEVIERLGNVVKELVENSLDALATVIDVSLEDSGMSLIRITDNGTGMDESDAVLAFERHTTSKIHSEYELFHLASLGFRGEALASISAVSRVELNTSLGGEIGFQVIIQDGVIIHQGLGIPNKGTDIKVSRLFYHTPARLKHLKSTQAELAYIVELMDKIALSRPDVAFHVTNNQKTLLKTSGNGKLIDILGSIYGIDAIREMRPFEGHNRDYSISGMLSSPLQNRTSKNAVTTVVNHRTVKNARLIQAIVDGLDQKLAKGRYPIAFLAIECDPLLIDANIHPTKQEIKFSEETALYELIRSTIAKVGADFSLIQTPKNEETYDRIAENQTQIRFNEVFPVPEPSLAPLYSSPQSPSQKEEVSTPKQVQTSPWPDFDYIGQYLGTYLLFQDSNGLYLLDQHAAAERIRYERYLLKMGSPTHEVTDLLIPLAIDFSNHEALLIQPYISELNAFGLTIEQSTLSTFAIKTIPAWFPKDYELVYAESVIRTLLAEKPLTIGKIMNELAILLACKHSIKANRYINPTEVKTLLQDLALCQNPHTCPHGRPILVKIPQYDIEKWFKRVM